MAGYINDHNELKTLIAENPELPLMFLANGDCNNEEYSWTIASARAEIIDVLDDKACFNDEKVYTDMDDFEEDLCEYLSDEHEELSETALDELCKEKLKEFESMWKKCIVVWIDAF